MSNKLWFYGLNNKQHGPISKNELIRLLNENVLSPDTLVWNEDLDNWTAASQVEELSAEIAVKVSPPPLNAGKNNIKKNPCKA